MDVLADAELLAAVRERHAAGVVFGGTSAGAAVMSLRMITGDGDFTRDRRRQGRGARGPRARAGGDRGPALRQAAAREPAVRPRAEAPRGARRGDRGGHGAPRDGRHARPRSWARGRCCWWTRRARTGCVTILRAARRSTWKKAAATTSRAMRPVLGEGSPAGLRRGLQERCTPVDGGARADGVPSIGKEPTHRVLHRSCLRSPPSRTDGRVVALRLARAASMHSATIFIAMNQSS